MCQYYPLCVVLNVVLLSENLAIGFKSKTSFKLFIDIFSKRGVHILL